MKKRIIVVLVLITVILVVGIGVGAYFIGKRNSSNNTSNSNNNTSQNVQTQNISVDESRLKSAINVALINIAKSEEKNAGGYYARYCELGRENNGDNLTVYVWGVYGRTDANKNEKSGSSLPLKLTFNLNTYSLVSTDIPVDGTNYTNYFSAVADKLKEIDKKDKDAICGETYYDISSSNSSSNYTSNLADAKNGRIAFEKLYNKNAFKTEDHGDYFTYIDQFNNKYDIKEIKKVASENATMSVDNTCALFKVTVTYLDKDNQTKTMDLAITLQSDFEAGCRGTYLNYTGTTSFVKAYTNLYDYGNSEEETKKQYDISGDFSGKFGTFTVISINDEQLNFKFNGASNPNGTGLMEISGIANKIPDEDKEATYKFEYDGSKMPSTGSTQNKPASHYRYETTVDGKAYKIIIYFTSDKDLTYLEWSGQDMNSQSACTMMNMWK